jgi:hypothetical protein
MPGLQRKPAARTDFLSESGDSVTTGRPGNGEPPPWGCKKFGGRQTGAAFSVVPGNFCGV